MPSPRPCSPNTKLFWVETPSNPLLNVVDIAAVASLRRADQIVAVDNTFATPYFQQPLALGAQIVVHSTTKYIGGHSDVVGGVAITDDRRALRSDQVSRRTRPAEFPGRTMPG